MLAETCGEFDYQNKAECRKMILTCNEYNECWKAATTEMTKEKGGA